MVLKAGEKLLLLVGLLASLAAPLRGQKVSIVDPSQANSPDGTSDSDLDGMHISPKPGEPFTARTVGTLTVDPRYPVTQIFSLVARDSSGRIYFERRRTYQLPPLDYQGPDMPYVPSYDKIPIYNFYIIDPHASTRTTCYVATNTCQIHSLRQTGDSQQESSSKLLQDSTTEWVSLGTLKLDGLEVVGKREITTIAARVVGNPKPIVTVKEVWYSPELDLDVAIKKVDPRTGTLTREMKNLSRGEPDPKYFAVPGDFVS